LPRGYNILNLLQILFFPDSRIPKTKLKWETQINLISHTSIYNGKYFLKNENVWRIWV
jgi:hypothetical protein